MARGIAANPVVRALIELAILEDAGGGDLTSELTIPRDATAVGVASAKQAGVLAGIDVMRAVFHTVDPELVLTSTLDDGARFVAGDTLAEVHGAARSMLTAERTALNFLQILSGIATATSKCVEAVKPLPVRVVDLRKTIPGWRALSKYAVRLGGGHNHRFSLSDGVLIKDNHIAVAGGVRQAIEATRAGAPHTTRIEVEVKTFAELDEALAAGADIILLDNMTCAEMKRAVVRVDGRATVEASGGVRLETIREVAETGADVISTSGITINAGTVDISFNVAMGDA